MEERGTDTIVDSDESIGTYRGSKYLRWCLKEMVLTLVLMNLNELYWTILVILRKFY